MIKANPNIAAMAPYALPDISAPAGVTPIVLAQNEHAFPPSQKVRDEINDAIGQAHLYSDSDWTELRSAIADVHRLDVEKILCGSGSMELMSALILSYLSSSDRILTSEYSYLFMRTLARMVGAEFDIAAEKDFHVDVDALLAEIKPDTKLVFVVNPGNPCGSLIHNDEIRRLRCALPEDVILMVDEAYAEYVEDDFHSPLFDLIESGNTVITRTFSKIYGLAGMRVGWGYYPPDIHYQLRKVLVPGSVASLSQIAANAAMQDQNAMLAAKREITRQRDYLSQSIMQLGLSIVSSHTNFVLVDFVTPDKAASAFDFLRARGIIVRPMGGYGLPSCLRVSVGVEAHMRQTINQLQAWLAL